MEDNSTPPANSYENLADIIPFLFPWLGRQQLAAVASVNRSTRWAVKLQVMGVAPGRVVAETLTSFPALSMLELTRIFSEYEDLNNSDLRTICLFTQLKQLNLGKCLNITDEGYSHLSSLVRLEVLSIQHSHSSQLTPLRCLTALRSLRLQGCHYLTGSSLEHLTTLSNLQLLEVSGCSKVDDKAFPHITKLSRLQDLSLAGCANIGLQGLLHFNSMRGLRSLNLSRCRNVDDACLQQVAQLGNLLDLDLQKCRYITDTGLAHLAALVRLQAVRLGQCKLISDWGVVQLSHLQLCNLDLSGCELITDDTLVSHISRWTLLKSLDLWGCSLVSDTGVSQLTTLKQLRKLCLSYTSMTSLAPIAHLTALEVLDVASIFGLGLFGKERQFGEHDMVHLLGLTSLHNLVGFDPTPIELPRASPQEQQLAANVRAAQKRLLGCQDCDSCW